MAGLFRSAGYGLADPSQPALSAYGFAVAALMMIIFGFIWLGWGFSASAAFVDFSYQRALPAIRWITFYLAFLILLGISIQAVRRARSCMKASSVLPDEFRARFSKKFRLIFFFEGLGCGLTVFLALSFHRPDLLAAGISFVVGLHFLPLARVFRLPSYFVAGVAIIACDLAGVVLLMGRGITVATGVATGAVLWITAIYALRHSREFAKLAMTAPVS